MSTDASNITIVDAAVSSIVPIEDASNKNVGYAVQVSPCGTRYYLPECPDNMKPVLDSTFSTLEHAVFFYEQYAAKCGFVSRHACRQRDKDIVLRKYMVCTREGYKSGKTNSGKRRRVSNRVGCKAKIVFKYAGSRGYVVHRFEERHTHKFVADYYRQFMKSQRNLDIAHKKFVLNCSKANIGPVRSHRLYKEIVGGYANIGASAVDFKNFKRDLLAYFDGSDAQTVINSLFQKRELCSAFYFDYDVDSSDRLTRLFIADPLSRKNFAYFGEVVSFDATYGTNHYDLVFAPFTGLDHHKRCVTFGVALMSKEDKHAYTWVLEAFKRAMGNDPKIFVTDQDGAIKIAVAKVFPNTRHRLCMWHIMQKLPAKTKSDAGAEYFRTVLNSIVWTHALTPAEFEEKWINLINDYPLDNKRWFNEMFAIREFWIPAYFRDLMFGGLLRTTSISEVQNNFFGHFTGRYFRLVELLVHYESALDAQRHTQAKLNFDCETMIPDMKTELKLEKHASEIYTLAVFYDIQNEICAACFTCGIASLDPSTEPVIYTIKEGTSTEPVYVAVAKGDVVCSCRMFQRIGLPCRHMFLVFINMGMDRIPERYVLSRWTKSATISPIFSLDGGLVQDCYQLEEHQNLRNTLMSDFYCCMGLVEANPSLLKEFSQLISAHKASIIDSIGSGNCIGTSTADLANEFVGTEVATLINVHPPEQAKNKGTAKRLMSAKEKSIEQRSHGKMRCGRCKKIVSHNARTCKEIIVVPTQDSTRDSNL